MTSLTNTAMISFFTPGKKSLIPNHPICTYRHHPQDTTPKHVLGIYKSIFKTWLPHSGYAFTGQYHMEWIDSLIARDDYCEIDLYIPLSDEVQASPPMRWLNGEAGGNISSEPNSCAYKD